MLNLWNNKKDKCLCEMNFSIMHFFKSCTIPEKLEEKLSNLGTVRKNFQFEPTAPQFLQSWILNWSNWKAYHCKRHQEDVSVSEDIYFLRTVRDCELTHLMYVTLTNRITPKKINQIKETTMKFYFYRLGDNQEIIDLKWLSDYI